MPRCTHVKKSRKKIPESRCGIEGGIPKGSAYYWWKFRRGGKRFSLTPPKRSQLTQSSFWATIFDLQDDTIGGDIELENCSSLQEDVKTALEELRDECQGNLDNIPQHLQEGHMLQERIENLESAINDVDAVTLPEDDAGEDEIEQFKDELNACMDNLS